MTAAITAIMIFALWVAWGLCVQYIGYPNFSRMLGGSQGFMLLLSVLLVASFRYKALTRLILCAVSMIFGLLVANFLYSYFLDNKQVIRILVSFWLAMVPFMFMVLSYGYTLDYFLLSDCEKKEDTETLRNFRGMLGLVFAIPFAPAFCLIAICHAIELRNINSLDQQIVLGACIAGGLLFLAGIKKAPVETLKYFFRPIPRIPGDIIKVRRWLTIITLGFLLYSSVSEFILQRAMDYLGRNRHLLHYIRCQHICAG